MIEVTSGLARSEHLGRGGRFNYNDANKLHFHLN